MIKFFIGHIHTLVILLTGISIKNIVAKNTLSNQFMPIYVHMQQLIKCNMLKAIMDIQERNLTLTRPTKINAVIVTINEILIYRHSLSCYLEATSNHYLQSERDMTRTREPHQNQKVATTTRVASLPALRCVIRERESRKCSR